MITIRQTAAALLSCLALVAGAASASVVTFDASGADNRFPFGFSPMAYQQVYASSQFGAGPLDITGIRFKQSPGDGFLPTPITLDIYLSTTQVTPSTIGANYEANQGTDATEVFSGTAVVSSSGTGAYDIKFDFTTAYSYDPSAGNLLVELDVGSSPWLGFFQAGHTDLLGRNYPDSLPFYRVNYGLATQFDIAGAGNAVPEPATLALLGAGLLGVLAPRRKPGRRA